MGLADILTVKQSNHNHGMTYFFFFILCLAFRVFFMRSYLIVFSENKLYFSGSGHLEITSDFLDLGKIT